MVYGIALTSYDYTYIYNQIHEQHREEQRDVTRVLHYERVTIDMVYGIAYHGTWYYN